MQSIGYMVLGGGRPMFLDQEDGVLYFGGNHSTFFRTRKVAQNAITATLADRPTFESEFGYLTIERLRPEPRGKSYQIEVDYEQQISVSRSLGR